MEKLLTPGDVEQITGLTPEQLAQLRWRGGGPRFVKLGRQVRYTPTSIEEWVRENTYERTDRPDRPIAASA